jgi:hypothetical protein
MFPRTAKQFQRSWNCRSYLKEERNSLATARLFLIREKPANLKLAEGPGPKQKFAGFSLLPSVGRWGALLWFLGRFRFLGWVRRVGRMRFLCRFRWL